MRQLFAALALTALAVGPVAAYCPEFMYNQTACSCTEYIDGAIIRCSGKDGPQMVEKLKKHPTEIRELALEHANILEIGPRAFGSLRIKKLVLDNNRIKMIQPSAFQGLDPVLQELSLNHNKLPAIPTDAIDGLKALNILSLKCNEIGNLTANSFVNLPTLLEVNLGCNKIANIAADAFDEVRGTLQNLNLDNNQLRHVPGKAVENMPQLIGLHIKYNKIERLESGQLANLPALAMLTLSGNRIASVAKDFVRNTTQLKYIYLNDNKITNLEPAILKQFETVEILDLSYNHFGDIKGDQFSVMQNLQQLILEGNRISKIGDAAFAGTPLVLLWLPYNCLSNITADMIKGIPFVKHISLKHNNIVNVNSYAFAHLPQLHTLDLTENLLARVDNNALQGTDFLTVRIQENPFVCNQDGFHVMNSREALFLKNEPNLVCKGKVRKAECPQKVSKPAQPVCACSKKTHKATTTTVAPSSTTTTEAPVAQEANKQTPKAITEQQLVAALAAAANLHQRSRIAGGQQQPHQQLGEQATQPIDINRAAEAARRLNMERFMRLSKAPTEAVLAAAGGRKESGEGATATSGTTTFLERQRSLLAKTEQQRAQHFADSAAKTKFSVSAPIEFSHDEQAQQEEVVQREERVDVPIAHVPHRSKL